MSNVECKTIQVNFHSLIFFDIQGTLEVRGWSPTFKNIPAMLLKNGDYKIESTYYYDNEIVFGMLMYVSIVNIDFWLFEINKAS